MWLPRLQISDLENFYLGSKGLKEDGDIYFDRQDQCFQNSSSQRALDLYAGLAWDETVLAEKIIDVLSAEISLSPSRNQLFRVYSRPKMQL